MKKIRLLLLSFVMLNIACTSNDNYQHVRRVDKEIGLYCNLDSTAQIAVLDSLRIELNAYFAVLNLDGSMHENAIAASQSRQVEVFQPDIDHAFPNLNNLERSLGKMRMKAQKSEFPLDDMRYASVAWGYPQSVVKVDSVMLIALNHYLGEDYPGYSHIPAYLRKNKTSEKLPYDVAEAIIATQYPYVSTHSHPTLLSRMLYEGAVVNAVMEFLPEAQLHLALGYDSSELEFVEDNMRDIWQEMALRKMIYSIDPQVVEQMIKPGPSTPLLQGRTPGRVGRYIGYKIVKEYLQTHPEATLLSLFTPSFYDDPQSLINSGF